MNCYNHIISFACNCLQIILQRRDIRQSVSAERQMSNKDVKPCICGLFSYSYSVQTILTNMSDYGALAFHYFKGSKHYVYQFARYFKVIH